MKKITIKIKTKNAAFADDPGCEIARILRDLADKIENYLLVDDTLSDSNGNAVGKVTIR